MTRLCWRCGGRKVRKRRKGVRGLWVGNGDGTTAAMEKITYNGDGDGADKARRQSTWEKDGDSGATEPAQAVEGAAHRGGGGDTVGGHRGGPTESTRGTVAPTTMVVVLAP